MLMLTQPTLRVPECNLDIKFTRITAGDQLLLIWYGNIYRSGATNGTGVRVSAVFLDLNSKSESALKYVQIPLELVHKLTIGSEVHARAVEGQDAIRLVLVGYKKAEIFSYAIQENADDDSLKFYREFKTLVPNQQDGKNKKYSYKSLSQTYNKVLERLFDRHQILCFERDGKTFVMHPLTWFMAYYASTKRINRYILNKPLSSSFACTQPKTRRSSTAHAPTLEDGLRLNVRTNTSNAVLLSDWMRLGDVTFLHHLKFDEYTQAHIRKIQASFQSSIHWSNQHDANAGRRERNVGFLSDIGIWHTEAVGLTFRAIYVGDNTYLVTSISSITHPYADGEPMHFEVFNKPEPATDEGAEESSDVDVSSSSVRILSTDLQHDDAQENVAIVDGDADNPTRLWVICKTSVVGEMRRLIKDKGDNPTNALAMIANKTRTQGSFIPEKFAVGEDKSKYANGLVGRAMLSSADKFRVADDCSVIDRHDYLFKLVKAKFAQVHYYCSVVDTGIIQNDELKYGDLSQLTCDFNSFPNRFLVLYGCLGGRWYAFVDLVPSESRPNIAGVAIYSASEALLQENIYKLLNLLAHEEGVLRNPSQSLSDNAKLTKYNHSEGGDWVETAIRKLA